MDVEILPTKRRSEAWMYIPKLLPSGELAFWDFALLLLLKVAPLLRYRARWAYASVHATRKHQATGPRHAAPTPLFVRLGWTQRIGELQIRVVEGLDSTPKTA